MPDTVDRIKQTFSNGLSQIPLTSGGPLPKLASYVPPNISSLAQQLLMRAVNSEPSQWLQTQGRKLGSILPEAKFPR